MSEIDLFPVPAQWAREARVDAAGYQALYNRSVAEPDAFWLKQAQQLEWMTPPTQAGDWSFDAEDFRIRWFADGSLNASVNCIDRHLAVSHRSHGRQRHHKGHLLPDSFGVPADTWLEILKPDIIDS